MSKFFDNPLLLVVLLVIIILVFGANKLPGAARSLGRSMRIFKSEVREMRDDDPAKPDHDEHVADRPLEGRVVDGTSGSSATSSARREADDEARRPGV